MLIHQELLSLNFDGQGDRFCFSQIQLMTQHVNQSAIFDGMSCNPVKRLHFY